MDLGFVLFGTREQGVPVLLSELMPPDGFDPVSPSFTIRDVPQDYRYTLLTNAK
ncbi:unnamed protein product [Schistosoma mattheei]|uniref:Uncharacterized protein n=1 Tax=Schistosoma mattheei TaxID=31246 RepID=A0A183Q4M7_9TREM|nr:unnamed protein product [Schistosoma mattheei]